MKKITPRYVIERSKRKMTCRVVSAGPGEDYDWQDKPHRDANSNSKRSLHLWGTELHHHMERTIFIKHHETDLTSDPSILLTLKKTNTGELKYSILWILSTKWWPEILISSRHIHKAKIQIMNALRLMTYITHYPVTYENDHTNHNRKWGYKASNNVYAYK